MHNSVLKWIADRLPVRAGLKVIELGSRDVNGSPRLLVNVLKPAEYVGVDLREGAGVDAVGDVACGFMDDRHGQFDLVISTETLEHVQSWPLFVRAMKMFCRTGGEILLTTRSPGFPHHEHPSDYWRFTTENLTWAFKDCDELDLRVDPEAPGVFLHCRKPENWMDMGAVWQQVATP